VLICGRNEKTSDTWRDKKERNLSVNSDLWTRSRTVYKIVWTVLRMNEYGKCPRCGKVFEKNKPQQIYCDEHKGENHHVKAPPKPPHPCLWCKTMMVNPLRVQRFCSPPATCNKEYWALWHRLDKIYFFEKDKLLAEIKKLNELGNKYVLKEVD
jgi:hypothetical protein